MDGEFVSDEDAAVWDAVGGDPEELKQNGSGGTVEVPEAVWQQVLDDLAELKAWKEEVDRKLDDADAVDGDQPVLYHYANIPASEREDLLSTSEQIAVTLHSNWEDIAWKLGDSRNRRIGVDTKTKANAKYNPSQLKHRLKSELGWSPESIQVHRALKRLAKLSGGEETTDKYGRVHIDGGEYEYHHRPTPDGGDVKHVLYRRTE